MSNEELKPCPFCGGKAVCSAFATDYPTEHSRAYIQCENCGAEIHKDGRVPETKKMQNEITKKWNNRIKATKGEST